MCAKRGIKLWTYRLAGRWIQRPGRGAGAPGRTESSGTLKTGPTIGSWNVDFFSPYFADLLCHTILRLKHLYKKFHILSQQEDKIFFLQT